MNDDAASGSEPLMPIPQPFAMTSLETSKQTLQPVGYRPAVLVLVEGTSDVQFLRRISATLHIDTARLPDLWSMERRGELVFIPFGGSGLNHWLDRLACLMCPEFFLLDREVAPVTQERLEAARIVNRRAGCRAFVTQKRALENYLHPAAISECRLIHVEFGDQDDVAEMVARECFLQQEPTISWSALPGRSRKRLRNRAKNWLNTSAVERMNGARLAERDPAGEVQSWLTAIADLAKLRP